MNEKPYDEPVNRPPDDNIPLIPPSYGKMLQLYHGKVREAIGKSEYSALDLAINVAEEMGVKDRIKEIRISEAVHHAVIVKYMVADEIYRGVKIGVNDKFMTGHFEVEFKKHWEND